MKSTLLKYSPMDIAVIVFLVAAVTAAALVWLPTGFGWSSGRSLALAFGLLFSLLPALLAILLVESKTREKGLKALVAEHTAEIRENEERLQLLEDNLPDSYVYQCFIEGDGTSRRFLYLSAGVERLHGVNRQDALRDAGTLYRQIDPEQLPDLAAAEAAGMRNLTDFQMDLRILLADGQRRWLHAHSRPRRKAAGQILWDGVVTDITGLKQAEESLRTSEGRLHTLVQTIPDLIWLKDKDGVYLSCNSMFERFFGAKEADIIGKTDYDFVDRELADFFRAHDCKAMAAGKPSTNEEWITFADDGHRAMLETIKTPMYDGSGTLIGVLGIGRDVTERKRAEEALRQSNTILQKIFEAIPDHVHLLDKNLRILEANWKGWYAYVPEEIRKRKPHCYEAYYGLDGPCEPCHTLEVLKTGKPVITEKYSTRAGHIEIRAYPLLDDSGEVSMVLEHIRDINEQWLAEKALRESEERYRLLIETANEGILVAQGAYLKFVNPMMLELTGYSEEELLSLPFVDFVHPDDRVLVRNNYLKRLEGEKSDAGYHFRILKNDKSIKWVDVRGVSIQWEGQRATLVFMTDITEQKKIEAQLIQAQKMESVGRLAGGVAHDFNNMLSVILGNAELALMKMDPDQPIVRHLLEIHAAAERSANLTRQLLAFARKQTIAPKVIDLNASVEGMLKMLQRLIGEDIDLAWMPGMDVWPVKMDPSQLDQIMANLCINARDAIVGEGNITLETANADFDEDYCSTHATFVPGEFTLLAVSDDGCGMDRDTMENIFDPFFTTKEMGKGTGLGLATVYGIVRQNNGFINVYSEPGQGTTFKIYLPRHTDKDLDQNECAREPAARGHETILLVEDDPEILAIGEAMLENLGYSVLAASTPDEAIRFAEEHAGKISLLLTDVVMPKMNGRDLAQRLQALDPGLICMFMSGYTSDVIAHRGVLEEGVHFIQKPFSMQGLAAKVREALDKE